MLKVYIIPASTVKPISDVFHTWNHASPNDEHYERSAEYLILMLLTMKSGDFMNHISDGGDESTTGSKSEYDHEMSGLVKWVMAPGCMGDNALWDFLGSYWSILANTGSKMIRWWYLDFWTVELIGEIIASKEPIGGDDATINRATWFIFCISYCYLGLYINDAQL